jgi:thiol-disulfide isomerase/thioredoxin
LPVSLPSGSVNEPAAPAKGGAAAGPLAGLNTGAMAAFVARPEPQALPDITLADGKGGTKPLADWRGKVVLLNIWATWCHPCREEMPTLDKLQAQLGGDTFEVVAANIDKAGGDKAKSFLQETGATHLALYTDPSSKLFIALKAVGMPTTLLIDREGREIGRLVGPAKWDSPEAVALIQAAIAAPAAGAAARN